MPLFQALLERRARQPQFQAGVAPQLMQAQAAPVIDGGMAFSRSFDAAQGRSLQREKLGFEKQQYSDAILRQEAALAEEDERLAQGREALFGAVAAGSSTPESLMLFDSLDADGKLAILQQELGPGPGPMAIGDALIDPSTGRVIYEPLQAAEDKFIQTDGGLYDVTTGQLVEGTGKAGPGPLTLSAGEVAVNPQTGEQIAAGPAEQADSYSQVTGLDLGYPENDPNAGRIFNVNMRTGEVDAVGGGGVTVNTGAGENRLGKVPAGMAAIPDPTTEAGYRIVPIEGSPAAAERASAEEKSAVRREHEKLGLNPLMRDINRVLDMSRAGAGGPIQGQAKDVPLIGPLTQSGQMAKHLESIKANVAFGELQEMRNNSPTGGAVGALSEGERESLSSLAGSLDPTLPEADLQKNLMDLGVQRITTVHGTDAQIDAAVKAGKLTAEQARQGKALRDQQIAEFRGSESGQAAPAGSGVYQLSAADRQLSDADLDAAIAAEEARLHGG
ncbi:MAG: hypothetical protein AAGA21_16345 [Pseudomonadota bacterium]